MRLQPQITVPNLQSKEEITCDKSKEIVASRRIDLSFNLIGPYPKKYFQYCHFFLINSRSGGTSNNLRHTWTVFSCAVDLNL